MKKNLLYIIAFGVVLLAASCKVNVNYNSVKYMPIVFDTLSRTDYVTTKKLSAEVTLVLKKGQYVTTEYKQGTFYKVTPVSAIPANPIQKFFAKLAAARAAAAARDATFDHALYALHQKYPDVDYFMDVRVFRKYTRKGKFKDGPETVTIYATGVDLKTDK